MSSPSGDFDAATPGAGDYIKPAVYLSSELSRMGQLSASMQLVAAILLLLAFVFSHFGVTSAQYGNSGAAGTGPSADSAGYLLGVAATVLAVATFVWT